MPNIPGAVVGEHTLCYDMGYGKDDTVFTHWAKQLGAAHAVQGWGMLVEQAAEAFFLWRGVVPYAGTGGCRTTAAKTDITCSSLGEGRGSIIQAPSPSLPPSPAT
jgi:shikimate 5-dehydrogenase